MDKDCLNPEAAFY